MPKCASCLLVDDCVPVCSMLLPLEVEVPIAERFSVLGENLVLLLLNPDPQIAKMTAREDVSANKTTFYLKASSGKGRSEA